VCSEVIGKVGQGDCAKKSSETSANANRAEFQRVGRGFVQGEEVRATEGFGNRGRNGSIQEKLKEVGESLEVWMRFGSGVVLSFEEGKISKEINVISKRASRSAFLSRTKGLE
jgi:hypothetical protein